MGNGVGVYYEREIVDPGCGMVFEAWARFCRYRCIVSAGKSSDQARDRDANVCGRDLDFPIRYAGEEFRESVTNAPEELWMSPPSRQLRPRAPDEWISFGRLLLAAVLWIPALLRKPRFVAAGLALSAFSDMADGAIAHLRGNRSAYARQLDTIADTTIMLSALGWLALTRPTSLQPLARTIGAIGLLGSCLLTIQWRRYRQFGALHIDSARAAAVVGHLYVLDVLWSDRGSHQLRHLFQVLAGGAAIESAQIIFGSGDTIHRSRRPRLPTMKRIRVQ